MSKVYSEQIQKAQTLVSGLKKNFELIKNHGITKEQIALLENDATIAASLNEEVEALRAQINAKVRQANKKLIEVKNNMTNTKKIVKSHFDQEKWQYFGIQDKR